jgi:hypothetical protein
MTNTHPRCHYPPGVNIGVPVVYDRMAANNNGVIVNASTIMQEESIQAQATDTQISIVAMNHQISIPH